jgi:hypothetical protein
MDLLQAVRIGLRDRRKEQLEKEKKDWDIKWRQREELREKEETRRRQEQGDDGDDSTEERRDREHWWQHAGSRHAEDHRSSRQAAAAAAVVYDALSPVRPVLPSPSALLHTVSNGYTQPLQSPPAAFTDSRRSPMDFTPPPSSSHAATPSAYSYQTPQPFASSGSPPPRPAAAAAVGSGSGAAAGVDGLKPIAVSNADDADWDLIELEQKDEWDD